MTKTKQIIKYVNLPCIQMKQGDRLFYAVKMKAKYLVEIAYASIRNVDDEPGAVQRILNTSRISDIKEFTLKGGDYPNAIVLNWKMNKLEKNNKDQIRIPIVKKSAQIIDGQHRVAGIRAAISEKSEIGEMDLVACMYEGLDTKACADIFLSINTEQKTVPRSLVYDLYGISSETIGDNAIQRARDVAYYLNSEDNSPYKENVKMPGIRSRGGIALSTIVSAIKPLIEEKGELSNIGIDSLEMQKQVILNYFKALEKTYGSLWDDKRNALNYGAGFVGAIQFFSKKIIPECNKSSSFETTFICTLIKLDQSEVILQEEIKGKGGTEAAQTVYERLLRAFSVSGGASKKFRI